MNMLTDLAKKVKVTVDTEYQQEYSNPSQQHFVFTYRISIENNSDKTIQLKTRHWEIIDTTYASREVEGEGVVGKQPILEPGQTHQYVSGCNLRSGIGKMSGYYLMEKVVDGKEFKVDIPEFAMVVPTKLN